MKDQIIITMGREHGSGGHYIADMIARELGIKLYDKDSIESEIVSEGYSEELIRRMDEKPVNFFASRRIGRFSNSLEVNVAEKTFDMIRAKAASGESFLLIGRCGEQVLKDDRLIVEGVQIVKKHVRATQQGQQAGIVAVEAPIHRSNVMVIDPETKQPTRVRIVEKEEARDGKVKTVRVRVAKKSGKELA